MSTQSLCQTKPLSVNPCLHLWSLFSSYKAFYSMVTHPSAPLPLLYSCFGLHRSLSSLDRRAGGEPLAAGPAARRLLPPWSRGGLLPGCCPHPARTLVCVCVRVRVRVRVRVCVWTGVRLSGFGTAENLGSRVLPQTSDSPE